jgi:hypothetical protein
MFISCFILRYGIWKKKISNNGTLFKAIKVLYTPSFVLKTESFLEVMIKRSKYFSPFVASITITITFLLKILLLLLLLLLFYKTLQNKVWSQENWKCLHTIPVNKIACALTLHSGHLFAGCYRCIKVHLFFIQRAKYTHTHIHTLNAQ